MVVCHPEKDDCKVLPMRTGSDGVGRSAIEIGQSVANTTLGCLDHNVRIQWSVGI